jgi:hypothetical protein
MHGVNKYMCEAKNKHGFTRIFIYVIIPSLIFFCFLWKFSIKISCIDTQIKPILNYSDIQSRSVVINWHVFNKDNDRFNHFIIYYRCLNNFNENINEQNEIINIQDYKQILIDPRNTFTFQVKEIK